MPLCICLPTCPFYNDKMANMPVTAERMRQHYCLTDNQDCARFIMRNALGDERVPRDLFPDQTERAHGLIHGPGLERKLSVGDD